MNRVLRVAFPLYVAAFLAAAFYSLVRFPHEELLDRLLWPYVLTGGALHFIDFLIPVTVTAALLAPSILNPSKERRKQVNALRAVSSSLSSSLALCLIYTVLFLGLDPLLRGNLHAMTAISQRARVYEETARAAESRGDKEQSLTAYRKLLVLDPGNRLIRDRLQQLEAQISEQSLKISNRPAAAPRSASPAEPGAGARAGELVARANGYLRKEDYFSAYHYASLALELDAHRQDARRAQAKAWEWISSFKPEAGDLEAGQLFLRKKEGAEALHGNDPISAYTIFLELSRTHPDDPDVKIYLAHSREEMQKISFFLDEAERAALLPGVEGILYVNGGPDQRREFVCLGRMIVAEEGTYFTGIETMDLSTSGQAERRLKATYGKLMIQEYMETPGREPVKQHYICMQAVDRDNPARRILPVEGGSGNMLRLAADPAQLQVFRLDPHSFDEASLDVLWMLRSRVRGFGYGEQTLELEILVRLLQPFAFLLLSLFATAVGWTFRYKAGGRPPLAGLLLIPLLPAAASLFYGLYLYAQGILAAFLLVVAGFTPSLTGLLLLQASLLLLALIWLAGQRND